MHFYLLKLKLNFYPYNLYISTTPVRWSLKKKKKYFNDSELLFLPYNSPAVAATSFQSFDNYQSHYR